MRVVFFETMPGEEEYFRAAPELSGHTLTFLPGPLTQDTVQQAVDADVVSVFVKSLVTPAVIDALPNVTLFTTRSTGFDHLDIAHAKEKGVTMANVPAYGSHTVAEFAFALMLTLSRKVYQAYTRLKMEGRYSTLDLEGFDLFGKTLGIVGTGRIGHNVISIAHGFGMMVKAYDPFPDPALTASDWFSYGTLDDVLSGSDIVTIHVPYMQQTHHLIGAAQLAKMKQGAFLINTARGEIVDTPALLDALTSGHLAGAGLDVLEGERDLKDQWELRGQPFRPADMQTLARDHQLMDLPNVVVTPHIAFETTNAMREIMHTTAATIADFTAGKLAKTLTS